MKNSLNNTALKILSVVMSFLMFFTMIISLVGVFVMLYNDFYTNDFIECESRLMHTLANDELFKLESFYASDEIISYYDDKNILYDVTNNSTGESITNYNGQSFITSASKTVKRTGYVNDNGEARGQYGVYYEWVSNYGESQYKAFDRVTDETLTELDTAQEYTLTLYIPSDMKFTDRFWLADKLITFGYNNRYVLIFSSVISLALCILIYAYMFKSVGHRADSNDISVCLFNRAPADVLTAIVFFICICVMTIFGELSGDIFVNIVLCALIFTFLYFVCLWYLISIVVQLKAKMLIKHTVLFWCFKKLAKVGKIIKHLYKNIKTVYKTAIIIAAFWAIELILMGVNAYESDNLIISWLIVSAVASVVILICAIAFQRVKKGGEKIVNGDLDNKIDTTYMFGDIKDFAESLNNINNGLQAAIDDKMKSERFKTELITNVSHDIKTPLTSIVNYVDLIKKEKCDNPKIDEYIEVLDRQSNRLKKLIEDLVEASKAQTGNLSVELVKCNVSLLINQAVGEFTERLEAKELQVVQSLESQEAYVMADGRRLWRVFDNLLTNICKYAMRTTRVYIDLICKNGKAVIIFKNISDQPINISGEELTERFVRGDRSRNTEGSGLGLSIAKSLTELQNGIFEIETDGDLFKAKLTFDLIE